VISAYLALLIGHQYRWWRRVRREVAECGLNPAVTAAASISRPLVRVFVSVRLYPLPLAERESDEGAQQRKYHERDEPMRNCHCRPPSIVPAGRVRWPRNVLQDLPRHARQLGYLRLDIRGTRCSSDLVCSNNRSRTTRRIKTAIWPLSVRKLTSASP
jgi:hypothetical protein